MEHKTAKDMNAVEKYVLGEMTGQERDQFEEHYFDCADCALDVQAAAAFVVASKEIFLEKPDNQLVTSGEKGGGKRSGWAGWLKPLIAIPTMAALIVMLGYEARQIKQKSAESRIAEAGQQLVAGADFGLRGGDREASEIVAVQVRAEQAFGLHFDFLPSQKFENYVGEIQDQAGRALIRWSIPADRINKEVKFVVASGRLAPGNYALVILGDEDEQAKATKVVVAKYTFTVEIIR